jgi:pyruvate kinase
MVQHLRLAEKETGKSCKIAFDLAGPKLRTGPVSPGAGVIRWKPVRNELGQVTTPAFIAFCAQGHLLETHMIGIPVKGTIFQHAQCGDLVELTDTRGRERLLQVVDVDEAEIQEEILWLCDAAHVPVIWATQVLESLAKRRLPSRAEVTDAAMSGRAECVMLNKGPAYTAGARFSLRRSHTHERAPNQEIRPHAQAQRSGNVPELKPSAAGQASPLHKINCMEFSI